MGDIGADIITLCRPTEIAQVLLNLLNNAHDAIQDLPDKWITIEYKVRDGEVDIVVTDSGRGIPRSLQDRLFQPFFTTKPSGTGTGLGLSISSQIVKSHGGSIRLDTECENTRFIVSLPTTLCLQSSLTA